MDSQNLLQDILGADNTNRQRAETELNNQRASNPGSLLQLFIGNMASDKPEVAQISCVLFKKYFLDNTEGVNPGDYEQMLTAVMQSLDFKQPMLLLKRKGDLISKLFMLQNKNEQLLGQLVEWAQSDDAVSKQFAMYIFEKQTECHLSDEQLKTHKDSFFTIFQKSMADDNVKVKVAAQRALVSFLLSIEDQAILGQFKSLTQQILDVTVEALKADQTLGQQALESIVNLAQTHAVFLQDNIPQLVKIISDIIKMKDFEEGTRSQATEVVLTLAEQVPATLRKEQAIKSDFYPALIQMLTECEEDMDAWTETADDEFGAGNDIYSTGVSSIERLAVQMKENVTLQACGPVISQCLEHQDWKVRQAGYLTSGLISESCKEHMKANMDTAFNTACKGIQDQHPRVKYAGLICLTSLLVQLKPLPQKKYHAELVPALLQIINSAELPKLRTQAVHCLFQFTSGLIEEDDNEINETKKSSDIMLSYSEPLFKSLVDNLTKAVDEQYEPMQEQVMNLLNAAATLIEEKFADYFNQFMPLMEKIIDNVESKTPSQMRLRARTIESMGIMITSVAEDRSFLPVVQRVTEKLFAGVSQEFSQDDPQQLAIKNTLAQTAYYLKEDFHVIAPQFLSILVKDASVEIKLTQENGDLPSNATTEQKSINFKLRGMEQGMRISINTSELENKIAAFHHIMSVSSAMGTSFEPYIATVLPVLQSHMNFTSKALRKTCLKTFQYLLIAKGEPGNVTLFRQFYELFVMNILGANAKGDTKGVKVLFKELFHCMRVVSENEENTEIFETPAKMAQFGEIMKQCLNKVAVQKAQHMDIIAEKHKSAQIDEEDLAVVQNELDKITGTAIYINECCSIMMNTYGASCASVLASSVQYYFSQVLECYQSMSPQELQDASYFFIEFIDKCDHSDTMFMYSTCNQLADICMWAKPEMTLVLQNAVYGIGVMSKHLGQDAFKTMLPKAMAAVERVTGFPEAKDDEHIVATENAYITLGMLAVFQTKDAAHLEKFLGLLPLSGEEEAQEANNFLLDQLLAKNEVFGGVQGAVKEALNRISTKYQEDDSILTEEGKEKLDQVISMV